MEDRNMKRWLCFFLFCLSLVISNAQRVEYYRWTKTYYKNGKIQAQNGNSGQFVTRTKNVCYDSDKHGYTVGNGSLHLVSQSGNTSKYAGPCYYGEECSYTFFDDKGILNISDFTGNVYVYKRSSSPNGRTTCSLIASKRSSVGSYIPSDNTVSSSRPNSRSHSSRTPQTRQRKRCTKCIGNPGVCPTCNGTKLWQPSIGSSKKIKCPNCTHGECSLCNGTGYYGYY